MTPVSPDPATCAHERLVVLQGLLRPQEGVLQQGYRLQCLDCLQAQPVNLEAFRLLRQWGRIVEVE